MNAIKKTVFTLNVDNYNPDITALTLPLMNFWADKIGADFHVIDKREFPKYPVTYEKLQIHKLGKEMKNDWNIFLDADALVHPDLFDPTNFLNKGTVMHNGNDMANNRWKYDEYFLRDGRHIGSCNWFTVASDWCIDLWKPLDDLTLEEALANILPIQGERNFGIDAGHLIDDYTLSRNIAKYGFKFQTMYKLKELVGRKDDQYLWHEYQIKETEKVDQMCYVINGWGLYQYYSEELGVKIAHKAEEMKKRIAKEQEMAALKK